MELLDLHTVHTPFSPLCVEIAIWHGAFQPNPGIQQGQKHFKFC